MKELVQRILNYLLEDKKIPEELINCQNQQLKLWKIIVRK